MYSICEVRTERDRHYSIGNPFYQLEHFHSNHVLEIRKSIEKHPTRTDSLFVRIGGALERADIYRRAVESVQRDFTLMASRRPQTTKFPASIVAIAIAMSYSEILLC